MRRAGALASAALLAIALGAAGCDLVSSLTPFGIGTQDYSSANTDFNGFWTGQTGNGGAFAFQVASDRVLDIKFTHLGADCAQTFELTAKEVRVVDDRFVYENNFSDQGFIHVEGLFISSATCAGSYSFKGLPASICLDLTSGDGSFTVTKTP